MHAGDQRALSRPGPEKPRRASAGAFSWVHHPCRSELAREPGSAAGGGSRASSLLRKAIARQDALRHWARREAFRRSGSHPRIAPEVAAIAEKLRSYGPGWCGFL
ncbi:hypothetical protein PCLA_08f0289 [Pseudomonas citronellolis]|nr:hypothetical protein PCLA_08f0289 [Pseudomonas citronellolis]